MKIPQFKVGTRMLTHTLLLIALCLHNVPRITAEFYSMQLE